MPPRQVYDYLYESGDTTPLLCNFGPKEVCIRPIQCNKTCDASICDAIEDGFHNDKFNGIISRQPWVTYGALDDKKIQPSTKSMETEFDLTTRLSQALEERKNYNENSAPSDTNTLETSSGTAPLPSDATTPLPSDTAISPKDANAAVLDKDKL